MTDRNVYNHKALFGEKDRAGVLLECKNLYAALIKYSTIDRFHPSIVQHPQSTFLGYLDITLAIEVAGGSVLPIKLRGIGVKILKGDFVLDMPAERGSSEATKDQFYDHFMPKSAQLRTVIQTWVAQDPEIVAVIAEAKTAPVVETDAGDDAAGVEAASAPNPFEAKI